MNQKKPLGIYIHIPFCQSKCAYCDFLSGPARLEEKKNYVQALMRQIQAYRFLVEEYNVKTIFIGGGTPSSIDAQDIKEILGLIYQVFELDFKENSYEITIEANPGTLTKEKLLLYIEAGINRISIGLQSANDDELKLLGRIHTYEQFRENYYMARACGFENINVDLMSALPGQTVDTWKHTLEKVCSLKPEHISAYSLIIEEGTPFYDRYVNHEEALPSEEDDRVMYHLTKTILKAAGYDRYEISNYAKPGFECKHNSTYWERIDYIGFGLGASSCIQNIRFHNTDNMQSFIKQDFVEPLQSELVHKLHKLQAMDLQVLTTKEQMEEFMFLGLRMMKGIDVTTFEQEFHAEFDTVYGKITDKFIKEGLLEKKDRRIYLTDRGIDISNYIMSEFLL